MPFDVFLISVLIMFEAVRPFYFSAFPVASHSAVESAMRQTRFVHPMHEKPKHQSGSGSLLYISDCFCYIIRRALAVRNEIVIT